MSKYYDLNSSIEGASFSIDCRRHVIKTPIKNDVLKSIVYPYFFEDLANTEIIKELDPKKPIIRETSILDKGSVLCGDKIFCFFLFPLRKPEIINRTGKHKAQYLKSGCFSFARIDRVWKALRNAISKKGQ